MDRLVEMQTNSGDTFRAMALAGQGAILQPGFLVADDLADGTLVVLSFASTIHHGASGMWVRSSMVSLATV